MIYETKSPSSNKHCNDKDPSVRDVIGEYSGKQPKRVATKHVKFAMCKVDSAHDTKYQRQSDGEGKIKAT